MDVVIGPMPAQEAVRVYRPLTHTTPVFISNLLPSYRQSVNDTPVPSSASGNTRAAQGAVVTLCLPSWWNREGRPACLRDTRLFLLRPRASRLGRPATSHAARGSGSPWPLGPL